MRPFVVTDLYWHIPEADDLPTPIVGNPVQLTPIPWGKPDPVLARVVLRHMAEFTPPTLIPLNPFTEERMRRLLRSQRIDHH